jgi:hypothetical protein
MLLNKVLLGSHELIITGGGSIKGTSSMSIKSLISLADLLLQFQEIIVRHLYPVASESIDDRL